ncbi:hypothetical protein C8R32_104262 [Nitrosospira sp. Nsp5]|uniref:Uncharacterized protein n=1 Tax=Nitrosospira multiformis TaxID=1231 RepID=A0ABY0TEZ4_9PROT|nr:hypothetical protein C8R32_104262 [Nitrosospira sp. Nsp5]SDQ72831.1 hypothetical protein SAMN05216402_2041 [Nitrosospira multiformis]
MVKFKEFLNEFPSLQRRAARAVLRNEVMIIPFLNSLSYELRSNVSLAWRQ